MCQVNERDTMVQKAQELGSAGPGFCASLASFCSCPASSRLLGTEGTITLILQGIAGGFNKKTDKATSAGLVQKACRYIPGDVVAGRVTNRPPGCDPDCLPRLGAPKRQRFHLVSLNPQNVQNSMRDR